MLSKYFSQWLGLIFIIWFIMDKFRIKGYNYINVYYVTLFLLISYYLLDLYYIFILEYKIECSLQIIKLVTHTLPFLYLVFTNKVDKKYALETFSILFIIYLVYLRYINKSVYQVYFVDKYPLTWKDLKKECLKDKGRNIPACNLII